jgi:hypothetical protein
MSSGIASSFLLRELPPEIWLRIFRIATFIPLETDLSVTKFEPARSCSYSVCRAQAFELVLPLRRTIVQVSRQFYQIGAEVLYTSFHTNPGCKNPYRSLHLFSDLLVLRPELGRFVKRLCLVSSTVDEELNHRIASRCPNVVIFSSCQSFRMSDRWWGGGLPKSIRSFDAAVHNVPMMSVLEVLGMLSHLEILHLRGLEADRIPHAPLRLPALRILSIYGKGDANFWLPLLSTVHLPCLTALTTNMGQIDGRLSFPLDVWGRLEYFQLQSGPFIAFRPEYFRNLRRLCLVVDSNGLQPFLGHFPFHQLESLTIQIGFDFLSETRQWKQIVDSLVVFPLDAKSMPTLKLFQFAWSDSTWYFDDIDYRCGVQDRGRLTQYLKTLVTKFEERGVIFVGTTDRTNL